MSKLQVLIRCNRPFEPVRKNVVQPIYLCLARPVAYVKMACYLGREQQYPGVVLFCVEDCFRCGWLWWFGGQGLPSRPPEYGYQVPCAVLRAARTERDSRVMSFVGLRVKVRQAVGESNTRFLRSHRVQRFYNSRLNRLRKKRDTFDRQEDMRQGR